MTRTRVVIYPKGMSYAEVARVLVLAKQFNPGLELIEDTTGAVVDDLIIYDRPEENRTLQPQFDKL